MDATYVAGNEFTVATDRTAEFVAGRRIKADCGEDGIEYCTVLSSSYGDPNTTIITKESELTANLDTVLYGIVEPRESGSLPDHYHTETEGDGGALAAHKMFSYNDATLSGTPVIVRFTDGGSYIHIKFYPDISATVSGTSDDVFTNLLIILDARLYGDEDLIALKIKSGGTNYYINGYQHVDTPTYKIGDRLLNSVGYPNFTLAGTPRVIEVEVDETSYYAKVYPNKT